MVAVIVAVRLSSTRLLPHGRGHRQPLLERGSSPPAARLLPHGRARPHPYSRWTLLERGSALPPAAAVATRGAGPSPSRGIFPRYK